MRQGWRMAAVTMLAAVMTLVLAAPVAASFPEEGPALAAAPQGADSPQAAQTVAGISAPLAVGAALALGLADVTGGVARKESSGGFVSRPLAATVTTYKKGWFINRNASGYAKVGEDAASEVFDGIADEEVEVLTGASAGDERIRLRQDGDHLVDFLSTLTAASVGKAAYIADNAHMALYEDVDHAVFGGLIVEFVSASKGYVDISAACRKTADLADAVS